MESFTGDSKVTYLELLAVVDTSEYLTHQSRLNIRAQRCERANPGPISLVVLWSSVKDDVKPLLTGAQKGMIIVVGY